MKKVTNRDFKKINRLNNQIMLLKIKRDTLIEQFVGDGKQFKSFRDFDAACCEAEAAKIEETAADAFEAKYLC